MNGTDLPRLISEIPGPQSRHLVDTLARTECPAITARRARRSEELGIDDDPIVWREAYGANVRDVDGNRYVDLTSGFGVALVGHRHPEVVAAASSQAARLPHAMGDAWPDATRIELLDRLAAHAPGAIEVSILGLSGSDAVDAAVKTAVLATGRTGVITFDAGYHGLSLGVLALQGYKPAFTEPFATIAHPEVTHLPWGCSPAELREAIGDTVGLVLAEPIQGRGGMRPAPDGWLKAIARVTRECGALFALDEIQTGFGRTGRWFGCEHDAVVPDLLCVGKALGGGFPISACMGTRAVMRAWGDSTGEALHTQTFLGHPVGCAAALAVIDLLAGGYVERAARHPLAGLLREAGFTVRGRGLMLGVEIADAFRVSRHLLRAGWIVLPTGSGNDALGLTPPVALSEDQARAFVRALAGAV